MKILLAFAVPAFCTSILAACHFNSQATIRLYNNSKVPFDSLQISVNDYNMMHRKLTQGDSLALSFNKYDINAKHDVTFYFTAYADGKKVLNASIFSNDLGHIPDSVAFVITDSMQVKHKE